MPIFRYFTVVGSALLVLLIVSDALFGEGEQRFDAAFYDSATYAPRLTDAAAAAAPDFTADATPADRISAVFGQFTVNDARRGKRYSSLATVIR